MSLAIVDTVYLVAYLRPSDPLHEQAIDVFSNLGPQIKISQASLIELDLLMKSRVRRVLEKLIPIEAIEMITPRDLAIATLIIAKHSMEYFDTLTASQYINRKALSF